jgi:hypothetical protein
MLRFICFAADNGSTVPGGSSASSTPTPQAPFNKRLLAELQETRDVIAAARLAPYATLLEDEYEITPSDIIALENMVNEAGEAFGIAHILGGQAQTSTAEENAAEEAIIAAIRRVQTGVRLTHPTSKTEQDRYFIGDDLENDEERLTQIAETILQQLQNETLRSVKPAHIQSLQDALNRWRTAHQARQQSGSGSTTDRARGLALMKQINAKRREIQIAIDGEFPYTNPQNAGHRKAFHIPEKRPFVVALK